MARKVEDFDRDLPVSSMLRLYNVLQDEGNRDYFLNIFKSLSIDPNIYNNESYFHYYTVEEDDWFDNISYKFYKTPNLWWVVATFNNITNPFEGLVAGQIIRVLNFNNVYTIFDEISNIERL